jgi:hypothetical protein
LIKLFLIGIKKQPLISETTTTLKKQKLKPTGEATIIKRKIVQEDN